MTGNDPDGAGKRSVRHYSADYMEAYLKELIEKFDYKSIYFDDDTFNLGNSHVIRMCEVMDRIAAVVGNVSCGYDLYGNMDDDEGCWLLRRETWF